jgi:hypothetical protein
LPGTSPGADLAILATLPGCAGQIFHAAQLSLAEGMRAVLYAMAGVMLVAAIVAAAGLRRGIHAAADTQAADTQAMQSPSGG